MSIIYVSIFTKWGGLPLHTENTVTALVREGHNVLIIHVVRNADKETLESLSRVQIPKQVTQRVVTMTDEKIGLTTLLEIFKIICNARRSSCVFSKGFYLEPGEKSLIMMLRTLSRHLTLIFHTEVPLELTPRLSPRWKGKTRSLVLLLRTAQMKFQYWLTSRFLTRVICVSENCARRLKILQPSLKARIIFSPNGIDCDRFKPKERAVQSTFVFGMMGRLSEEKAIHLAIEAFDSLIKTELTLDAQLHVYGEGPTRADLQKLIDSLGLADRVTLMGYCATPEIVYPQFDAYLMSSLSEVSPFSLLEAMACGVIPIVPAVGDIPRMVGSQFTFEPGSRSALATKMREAVGLDTEARKKMGRGLRSIVETNYNAAKSYPELVNFITHPA